MIIYYLVAALGISLINIGILMYLNPNRTKSYYTTMFHLISIQIAGHLFLALSTDLNEAILANKMAYIGAVYIPMLFFLGELTLCNIKISIRLNIILFTISTIVICLAASAGWSNIFYEKIELVQHNGMTDFTAVYGPAHALFNIVLAFYLVSGFIVFVYSLLKNKNISYKNLLGLGIIGFVCIGSFFVSRELGSDMLVMPAVFLIMEFILMIIIHRIGKYDIQGTILDSLEFQNENAYISFTKDKRYIGSNNIAQQHFPDLKSFRVDAKIPDNSDLGRILLKQFDKINSFDTSIENNFQFGRKHYKCSIRNLIHGGKMCGYMLRIEDDSKIQRYIKLPDQYNNDLVANVRDKDNYIQSIQQQMILGMANIVESRDKNTIGHFRHTSEVARIIVNEMKKDESYRNLTAFLNDVIKAAPMHDLGKIAIDDAILRNTGKYTPEEYRIMQTHAEKGAAIVDNLLRGVESEQIVSIVKNVANFHHERWDGSGYPKKLKGEQIPLEARIIAIADVYDALVSFRCYKDRVSFSEAFNIIMNGMGKDFDPKLKKFFINSRYEIENYYSHCDE
ncbi:HD domain-containing phosphohydrolase [uncultured Fibrobacter sp.]|uniref:HD domain-containing phosphohydrolase n=1 Tax=uncultured Fibrobacter sp. TaxID=261512 RepID=UPI0026396A75|nr:HD domain-containing phosphohydrolase [uncultured Fibrobacter sp.]